MSSTQRFVIRALIVLLLLGVAAYGVGVWSLGFDAPAAEAAPQA